MTGVPNVPLHLAGRPTVGGLVVPWITPTTVAGLHLFGKITAIVQRRCLAERRCQVCGQRLGDLAVLFARDSDLTYQCAPEPATCPPCHAYSARACPMLSGRRSHYRAGEHPALAGTVSDDAHLRQGAPAELWSAVWVREYDVTVHPAVSGALVASWAVHPPARIRRLPAAG
ncbi:hypothetical protein Val02_62680 [Virgisporangium aliadipatigenens]|uniref:Uncharacterized protein n=1 Tax=Virgisporangium aliadipatigenens TaxID=741659 RepID=A0A8J3YRL5_9ACTN|nr:hypothetical protein [Virgisporangium aliadipatigenens]GIJ49382.1 hypothetical protein Val02_62680 [Virgisporangium aliadipatigenens]